MDKIQLGSKTAKNGFANERYVADKFNNYLSDKDAQNWLKIMGYQINEIEFVKANILHGYKADINLLVQIKLKQSLDIQNIQVKLISNKKGFNQVDKRWLSAYQKMWQIDNEIYEILQYFVGEKPPKITNPKDNRRMNLFEFNKVEQEKVLEFFRKNKLLIISDILRGRGEFAAEWVLVIKKLENYEWTLKNINEVMSYYANGDVRISPKGSLYIGKITMQRKGGDAGRKSANMLQFKINPGEIFDI